MAVDLKAIRAAVADRVAVVPGVRVLAQVPASMPVGSLDLVIVTPDPTDYVTFEQAAGFTRRCDVRLKLLVVVPSSRWEEAQDRIDELLSTGTTDDRSVRDAVEGHLRIGPPAWGGVACDVTVLAARMIEVPVGADTHLGAEFDVQVLARSS